MRVFSWQGCCPSLGEKIDPLLILFSSIIVESRKTGGGGYHVMMVDNFARKTRTKKVLVVLSSMYIENVGEKTKCSSKHTMKQGRFGVLFHSFCDEGKTVSTIYTARPGGVPSGKTGNYSPTVS